MAFINKPVEVGRLGLRGEFLIHGDNGLGLFGNSVLSLLGVHPFAVLFQLILPLELFAAIGAQKFSVI